MTYKSIKYILDTLGAMVLFLSLVPLLIFIAILIFLTDRQNPFFVQERTGLNNSTFRIIKFRTMQKGEGEKTTKLGALLRVLSLDELPQLINIISGDMSFIGPRPLLAEYNNHYSNGQNKRHSIKPGITGWAQVNGRNTISWKQKFNLDVWYVENMSFLLDIKILGLTIIQLFRYQEVSIEDKWVSE